MFISHTISVSKALVISAAVLLWCGLFSSALAQPNFDPRIDRAIDSPNPKVNRGGRQGGKPSPAEAKRQAIEDAIDAGNKARDDFDFPKALASYRRVAEELNPKDARAFYGLGNVYSDVACGDNAIRAYNDAVKLKKDFRDAIIALAGEYANKERFDEAEAQFRILLNSNPKDVAGSMGLAFVLGKRKQYQEAITKLNLITSNSSVSDKDRANAHLLLGNIYLEQRKYPEAAIEYKEVIKLKHFLASAYARLGQTELFPAMSKFGSLVREEVRIEDLQNLIRAAKYAHENIRIAIYEHNYKHPYGYLLLSYASLYQFSYQEAESNLNTYLRKVQELEKSLPVLATNCDYGFKQLYSNGYLAMALAHQLRSNLEIDPQKKAEVQEKIIENARKLIQLKESDSSAYGLIGYVYFARGRYQEAIEQFEKAVTYETNTATKAITYEVIAFSYSSLGRDQDAIAAYGKARTLRPESTSAIWGLARIHEKRGDFDEAIRLKKEAMGREPVASSYATLASTYLAKARRNNSDADFEEAISLLKKAINMNPTFGTAYFLLGQVYKFYKGGVHADEAIANYETAAKYNPKDASIYFHLGDLYYAVKKNYDAAIKYLRDAINLDPNFAQANWELGAVYRDKGDDVQAVKYFLEAIRADRSHQDAYFSLVAIYRSQKKYVEAIELLQKLFEIAPKEAWSHKEMAKIYEAQQRNDDAIKYYQQAIGLLKSDDTFGKALYTCRIERLRRNYDQAIRCFQNLKPPSSEDPGQQAYDIGLTYVASGNKKEALEQHEQLKKVGSALAAELMSQINEMK